MLEIGLNSVLNIREERLSIRPDAGRLVYMSEFDDGIFAASEEAFVSSSDSNGRPTLSRLPAKIIKWTGVSIGSLPRLLSKHLQPFKPDDADKSTCQAKRQIIHVQCREVEEFLQERDVERCTKASGRK